MTTNDVDTHIIFAQVLALELNAEIDKAFIAASDRVLMRLWSEGFKIAPVGGEDVAHDRHESPAELRATNANDTQRGEPVQPMPDAGLGK